jgi:multiple sugar transport system ATP-binding protein
VRARGPVPGKRTQQGHHAVAQVSIRKVVKEYDGGVQAVKGIDLEIADHEFVVLVGPSGCGKSTTLRMIAGLEEISGGEISIGGRVVNDVPPRDRDIAMVFQNYALYPHMSVFDNMAFGLKLRGFARDEIKRRVDEAARILDITPLLARKPKALSGGQRQRVAMGRAIVRNPKVFLFDEPLSNLDAKLRVQMRTEIKKVHQTVNTTTVYVTHDQVEAMTLADRVVVMNHGIIEQVGPPQELYHRPTTRFVAGFIGSPAMNFIPARVTNGNGLNVTLENGTVLPIPPSRFDRYGPHKDRQMLLGIRPEHMTERKDVEKPNVARMDAMLDVTEPMGMETLVHFRIGSTPVCARVDPSAQAEPNHVLPMSVDMNHMHLIETDSGRVV